MSNLVELRLDAIVAEDRSLMHKFRLFPLSDCEAFIGRDDSAGRFEGADVYDDLADCADQFDWSGLADWCDHATHDDWCDRAESSDCDDPTVY